MKLSTKIIKRKVEFDYGIQNGLRYIQILMAFGTFFEVLKLNTGISRIWYFIVVPVGLLSTWILGKLLMKYNLRKREVDYIAKQNNYLMDIHKKINQLK
jgi:hypothetical protein